jgi:hypothetical protein
MSELPRPVTDLNDDFACAIFLLLLEAATLQIDVHLLMVNKKPKRVICKTALKQKKKNNEKKKSAQKKKVITQKEGEMDSEVYLIGSSSRRKKQVHDVFIIPSSGSYKNIS